MYSLTRFDCILTLYYSKKSKNDALPLAVVYPSTKDNTSSLDVGLPHLNLQKYLLQRTKHAGEETRGKDHDRKTCIQL